MFLSLKPRETASQEDAPTLAPIPLPNCDPMSPGRTREPLSIFLMCLSLVLEVYMLSPSLRQRFN